MNKIDERISQLRAVLERRELKAFIIPTNDPHFSEYVSEYYKCRKYITGFSGSAGWAVITLEEAALWSDSRYFLQAEIELEGSEVELMKLGYDTTPSISQWLNKKLTKGDRVGIDAKLYSAAEFKRLKREMPQLVISAESDPFLEIWKDRPELPKGPIFSLDITTTGESSIDKVARVRRSLLLQKEEVYIVSTLDDIAWLLNIRGADVSYTPVVISYVAIESERVLFFVDKEKVDDELNRYFSSQATQVRDYNSFIEYLKSCNDKTFIINTEKTNIYTSQQLSNIREESGPTVIADLKSVKNKTELEGFKRAMIEDGIALIRFNIWLEEKLATVGESSEWEVAEKLIEYRSQSPLFKGESFASIVGYKSNGAIVHYKVTPESSQKITADGFLLIDSGGQYLCGTTDITRTFHLSTPTREEQRDFTLVLIGNINLSRSIFPAGTRGSQLDILARKSMNSNGINYMHGTGHGIGHFLNVHEGPQSIRKEENSVTIKEGMVTSNEPAMYRTGKYGIRTENVIVATPHSTTEFGDFLQFETITLFPIDIKSIDINMLSPNKRAWLNRYHQTVYNILSQHLNAKEQLWLAMKTKQI